VNPPEVRQQQRKGLRDRRGILEVFLDMQTWKQGFQRLHTLSLGPTKKGDSGRKSSVHRSSALAKEEEV
jgi:hypothetical protein